MKKTGEALEYYSNNQKLIFDYLCDCTLANVCVDLRNSMMYYINCSGNVIGRLHLYKIQYMALLTLQEPNAWPF